MRQELNIEMPRIQPLTPAKIAIQEHSVLKIVSTESDKRRDLCTGCVRDFSCSKTNHVKDHIESQTHQANVTLKKKTQSTFLDNRNRTEDSFTFDLVDTWIKASIPFHTLKNPHPKNFLKNFRRNYPCTLTLYTTYSDKMFEEKWKKLLAGFSGAESFYVLFDEAEYFGEKYYAFLVGKLENSATTALFLVQISKDFQTPNNSFVESRINRGVPKNIAKIFYAKLLCFKKIYFF